VSIEIISKRDGFHRCGVAHSVTPTEYPDDRFSPGELKRLQEEPMLTVRSVEASPPQGETGSDPEFMITREYLETKTKKELAVIAGEIGLAEYLAEKGICKPEELTNRKKEALINLFLEEGYDLKGWKPPTEI